MHKESTGKIRVLLEMRPALDGFSGIPQEVRLLFRGLSSLNSIALEGFLQASIKHLAAGAKKSEVEMNAGPIWRPINRYSKVIISIADNPKRSFMSKVGEAFRSTRQLFRLQLMAITGFGSIKLTHFVPKLFEDFVWRSLFSKTLPSQDFASVTKITYRVCSAHWNVLHRVGFISNALGFGPRYAVLDTKDIDVFIGQTPFPGRVREGSKMVIRYHDAIPVFMPHTIPFRGKHQATHLMALIDNVASGAYFACVSESTRQDLLKIFPEVESRAVTIHNMVSHHYYLAEAPIDLIPEIIRSRLYEASGLMPTFSGVNQKESFYRRHLRKGNFRYLLMVSSIEPRKNHSRLLAAWEVLRAECDPDMKLVIVGSLGWDYADILSAFKPWIDRAQLFMLSAVPAAELRMLYACAAATVCPSFAEGFDFSGVEAMSSGGLVVASDIQVHREVYAGAAEYFDPYSTASVVDALKRVLFDAESVDIRASLKDKAIEVSSRYLPEKILPQWEKFLAGLVNK